MWIGLEATYVESDDVGRYQERYSRPRVTIVPLLQRVGKTPIIHSKMTRE